MSLYKSNHQTHSKLLLVLPRATLFVKSRDVITQFIVKTMTNVTNEIDDK